MFNLNVHFSKKLNILIFSLIFSKFTFAQIHQDQCEFPKDSINIFENINRYLDYNFCASSPGNIACGSFLLGVSSHAFQKIQDTKLNAPILISNKNMSRAEVQKLIDEEKSLKKDWLSKSNKWTTTKSNNILKYKLWNENYEAYAKLKEFRENNKIKLIPKTSLNSIQNYQTARKIKLASYASTGFIGALILAGELAFESKELNNSKITNTELIKFIQSPPYTQCTHLNNPQFREGLLSLIDLGQTKKIETIEKIYESNQFEINCNTNSIEIILKDIRNVGSIKTAELLKTYTLNFNNSMQLNSYSVYKDVKGLKNKNMHLRSIDFTGSNEKSQDPPKVKLNEENTFRDPTFIDLDHFIEDFYVSKRLFPHAINKCSNITASPNL